MAKRQSSDMTATEFREACAALGVSPGKLAPSIGVSTVQSYDMAAGRVDVPLTEATLLRLMVRLKITPAKLQGIANPLGS